MRTSTSIWITRIVIHFDQKGKRYFIFNVFPMTRWNSNGFISTPPYSYDGHVPSSSDDELFYILVEVLTIQIFPLGHV